MLDQGKSEFGQMIVVWLYAWQTLYFSETLSLTPSICDICLQCGLNMDSIMEAGLILLD